MVDIARISQHTTDTKLQYKSTLLTLVSGLVKGRFLCLHFKSAFGATLLVVQAKPEAHMA